MPVHFPNESADYRAARDRLLEKEIELRRQMEAVAEERRKLPPGGRLKEDYVFDGLGADGRPARIRFSELFAPGRDTLIVYHMMFPRYPTDTRPKPAEGVTGGAAARGDALSVLHGAGRPVRGRGQASSRPPASTSSSSPRRRWSGCWPSRARGAGDTCGCCRRPATASSATTGARMRKEARTRCCRFSTAHPMASVTSGARSCSPPNPSPGRTSAPSARWSRCGTSST